MHLYIIYAHPAKKSFNREVLNAFTRGLSDAGHSHEIGDLHAMNFQPLLDVEQYQREVGLDPEVPVPADVKIEHDKIDRADALVFIYPVWWSDVPAIMKGWFDRVFSYGYAYFYDSDEERLTRIHLKKVLVICSAGHTVEHLEEIGMSQSMRKIMLEDRLGSVGIKDLHMEILGGMMPGDDTFREENLRKAYELGRGF